VKEIALRVKELDAASAGRLESAGLITFVGHPENEIRRTLAADYYKGKDFPADRHGFHSVTITYRDILLSSHPKGQDEIVFMWDSAECFKPLFFVFALHKRDEYLKRLKSGAVTEDDYVALRVPYNDPGLSSFIVWHGTVHCECTDPADGETLYPSFFVLEPQKLVVDYTRERDLGVDLTLKR
jgi:hypothetical protein